MTNFVENSMSVFAAHDKVVIAEDKGAELSFNAAQKSETFQDVFWEVVSSTPSYLPDEITLGLAAVLIISSILASAISATTSLGGGAMMLAILALILPQAALIPIHGVLQLGSNFSRVIFFRKFLMRAGFLMFAFGSLGGAAIGGLAVVKIPPGLMFATLAIFILWSVWGSMPDLLRKAGLLSGGFASGILTMFVGATGPFVAAFLRTGITDRRSFIAVHSACMTIQHTFKLAIFGVLGFNFAPYLPLVSVMIVGSFLGSYLGRHILMGMSDVGFHKFLRILLTIVAVRLLWLGIVGR